MEARNFMKGFILGNFTPIRLAVKSLHSVTKSKTVGYQSGILVIHLGPSLSLDRIYQGSCSISASTMCCYGYFSRKEIHDSLTFSQVHLVIQNSPLIGHLTISSNFSSVYPPSITTGSRTHGETENPES